MLNINIFKLVSILLVTQGTIAMAVTPLNLVDLTNVEPPPINMLITLDDSLSMNHEFNTIFPWTIDGYINYSANPERTDFGAARVTSPDQASEFCKDNAFWQGSRLVGTRYIYIYGRNSYFSISLNTTYCRNSSLSVSPTNQETYPYLFDVDWRYFSAAGNSLYYNPNRTYLPWPGKPNASFTAAREWPTNSNPNYYHTHNLGTTPVYGTPGFHFVVWQDSAGFNGPYPQPNKFRLGANGKVDLWDNHTVYRITETGATKTEVTFSPNNGMLAPGNIGSCNLGAHDPALFNAGYDNCFGRVRTTTPISNLGFGRSLDEERQNIANWFQYYRNRAVDSRSAMASIINNFPDINFGVTNLGDASRRSKILVPVKANSADPVLHNQTLMYNLLDNFFELAVTPLGASALFAGSYFRDGFRGHPSPIETACDQNFHAIITDGDRNSDWHITHPAIVGYSNDGYTHPTDRRAISIADIAAYFFNEDLAPDLPNSIISRTNLCAQQTVPGIQSVTTLGLSYGPIPSNYSPDQCWPAGVNSSFDWGMPYPLPDQEYTTGYMDLWHAAYKSNGIFNFIQNSAELENKLSKYIDSFKFYKHAFGKSALNTNLITPNTLIFNVWHDTAQSSGSLIASRVSANPAGLVFNEAWRVGHNVAHTKPNKIFTFNPLSGNGVAIQRNATNWLTTSQHNRLFNSGIPTNNNSVLANAIFDSPLGPVINSNVVVIGKPNKGVQFGINGIQNNIYGPSFNDFVSSTSRPEMVYVQSNDGMLHGFDTQNGQAKVTFVPDKVLTEDFKNATLARVDSSQPIPPFKPRLDGELYASDVKLNNGDWATVLIGAMRKGGQGYYALNITDPNNFNASKVLWEFTDTNDADLGYTYSKAAIGRFANGQWLAVFGNGYNNTAPTDPSDTHISSTGNAVLYLVNIETGALVAKFDSKFGSAQDPISNRPNGFNEPALVDKDFDGIIDSIFVGDYFGNVFEYDVRGTSPTNWKPSFGTVAAPQPLVKGQVLNNMPITIRPLVTYDSVTNAFSVIIGTGDNITKATGSVGENRLIAFKVGSTPITNLSNFQKYELETIAAGKLRIRALSTLNENLVDGWFMNLGTGADALQVATKPQLNFGQLVWNLETVTPSGNDCEPDGTIESYVLAMNSRTGASLGKGTFAEEDETRFIDAVLVANNLNSSEILRSSEDGREFILGSTKKGIIAIEKAGPQKLEGRMSWRPL